MLCYPNQQSTIQQKHCNSNIFKSCKLLLKDVSFHSFFFINKAVVRLSIQQLIGVFFFYVSFPQINHHTLPTRLYPRTYFNYFVWSLVATYSLRCPEREGKIGRLSSLEF